MEYITKSDFNKIKKLLESKLDDFRNDRKVCFHNSMRKLSSKQMYDLAQSMYHSSVWGESEEPEGTAMFPSYRAYNEKPKWNIGSFGSVWMDTMIGKDEVRLAFYYDLNTGDYQFKIDELDGMSSPYMSSVDGKSKGGSNYTPPKKKRKK